MRPVRRTRPRPHQPGPRPPPRTLSESGVCDLPSRYLLQGPDTVDSPAYYWTAPAVQAAGAGPLPTRRGPPIGRRRVGQDVGRTGRALQAGRRALARTVEQ